MTRKYKASDDFIAWAQSLSGMLTKIRTEFGSVSAMIEHPEWDESKTDNALFLIKSLRAHLSKIDRELSSHVQEKFGKDSR